MAVADALRHVLHVSLHAECPIGARRKHGRAVLAAERISTKAGNTSATAWPRVTNRATVTSDTPKACFAPAKAVREAAGHGHSISVATHRRVRARFVAKRIFDESGRALPAQRSIDRGAESAGTLGAATTCETRDAGTCAHSVRTSHTIRTTVAAHRGRCTVVRACRIHKPVLVEPWAAPIAILAGKPVLARRAPRTSECRHALAHAIGSSARNRNGSRCIATHSNVSARVAAKGVKLESLTAGPAVRTREATFALAHARRIASHDTFGVSVAANRDVGATVDAIRRADVTRRAHVARRSHEVGGTPLAGVARKLPQAATNAIRVDSVHGNHAVIATGRNARGFAGGIASEVVDAAVAAIAGDASEAITRAVAVGSSHRSGKRIATHCHVGAVVKTIRSVKPRQTLITLGTGQPKTTLIAKPPRKRQHAFAHAALWRDSKDARGVVVAANRGERARVCALWEVGVTCSALGAFGARVLRLARTDTKPVEAKHTFSVHPATDVDVRAVVLAVRIPRVATGATPIAKLACVARCAALTSGPAILKRAITGAVAVGASNRDGATVAAHRQVSTCFDAVLTVSMESRSALVAVVSKVSPSTERATRPVPTRKAVADTLRRQTTDRDCLSVATGSRIGTVVDAVRIIAETGNAAFACGSFEAHFTPFARFAREPVCTVAEASQPHPAALHKVRVVVAG